MRLLRAAMLQRLVLLPPDNSFSVLSPRTSQATANMRSTAFISAFTFVALFFGVAQGLPNDVVVRRRALSGKSCGRGRSLDQSRGVGVLLKGYWFVPVAAALSVGPSILVQLSVSPLFHI